MGKYVLKRIGYIVLVFLIISLLMYALYNLIPSDPARAQLEYGTAAPVAPVADRKSSIIELSL